MLLEDSDTLLSSAGKKGCDGLGIEASLREQAVAKSIHPEICFCQGAGVSERKAEEKLLEK